MDEGHKTALAGTIRFAIGDDSRPNLYKMTVPGRGFLQKFLRDAVKAGATHAVVELTSEGALQYRHACLDMNALVFTNLQEEHLESHGGMENYFRAKFRIAKRRSRAPASVRARSSRTQTTHTAAGSSGFRSSTAFLFP